MELSRVRRPHRCVVWTGDDRVFFFNPTMQLSVWEKPLDLRHRGDLDRILEDPPHKRKLEASAGDGLGCAPDGVSPRDVGAGAPGRGVPPGWGVPASWAGAPGPRVPPAQQGSTPVLAPLEWVWGESCSLLGGLVPRCFWHFLQKCR